ncbi:MAG: hypothetical protein ACRETD_07195 [Steroidobacteraceae bacterium]
MKRRFIIYVIAAVVGAEQTKDLAVSRRERGMVHRGEGTKLSDQILDLYRDVIPAARDSLTAAAAAAAAKAVCCAGA